MGWKIKANIKRKTQKSASELELAGFSQKTKHITQNIAERHLRRGDGRISMRTNG
jgi:hypothetical protein